MNMPFKRRSVTRKIALGVAWLCFALAGTQASYSADLSYFLALDRFHYYITEWAHEMRLRGNAAAADAIFSFDPQTLAREAISITRLSDAQNYDELIFELIKKKSSSIELTREQAIWDRGFLKNKLNEAYRLVRSSTADGSSSAASPESAVPSPRTGTSAQSSALPDPAKKNQIALNVDPYISSRTTRAIFWDATANGTAMEFHLGSLRDFQDRLAERGARVVGEIKTLERNYNKIYLIQEPGQSVSHYAITGISGADRLGHLVDQLSLARWTNAGKTGAYEIFGDALKELDDTQDVLRRQLETLPVADQVIIGQKGAIERSLRAAAKADAASRLCAKVPPQCTARLNPKQQKLLNKIQKSGEPLSAFKEGAKPWDDLYEAIEGLFEKEGVAPAAEFEVFTVDNGSHEYSDFLLKDAAGGERRWRVFSNVWGDEVTPIARALKETGHTRVTYIGTAGALSKSGLKVGELVAPDKIVDSRGKIRVLTGASSTSAELPEFTRTGMTVAHVTTPYEETWDWIQSESNRSQLVELESGYLAEVFSGKKDKLRAFLLISDVVGSESETLAEADSSKRKKAQEAVLNFLFADDRVTAPSSIQTADAVTGAHHWIRLHAGSRDLAAQYQLEQKARALNLSSEAEIRQLISREAAFDSKVLEERLLGAGADLQRILEHLDADGVSPKVALAQEFLQGSWHPKKDPMVVELLTQSALAESELKNSLAELYRQDPQIKTRIVVKTSRGPPSSGWNVSQVSAEEGSACLLSRYNEQALLRGGLASGEGRTGRLRYTRIRQTGAGSVASSSKQLSYFAPDQATQELLQALKKGVGTKKALEREIERINLFSKDAQATFRVSLVEVENLPDKSLAQLVPRVSSGGSQLMVELRVTPEALKQPVILLEEIIHLQQITRAPAPWAKKADPFRSFMHPYHWAEVVSNAESGSSGAILKLARTELEALSAAEETLKFYVKSGFLEQSDLEPMRAYFDARRSHAEERLLEANRVAKQDFKERWARWERTKGVRDQLEKQADKLNDLVAKNDRRGVKKLIEQYVPWDLMEPSETQAWRHWLDAMESPDPSRTQLVFRGMYDDTIMKTADGTPFLMSTMLSRNQGNYTRRLRSFATMRDKFGSQQIRDATTAYTLEGKNPSSLSVMMGNHAIEAKGSPFLSVADYDTATHFGPRKLGAFMIDERRLMPNPLPPGKYLWEQEKLVPLIIFPDELIYFHDYWGNPVEGVGPKDPVARKKHFLAEVENKLSRKLTRQEISGTGNSTGFLGDGFERLKSFFEDNDTKSVLRVGGKKGSSCKEIFGSLSGGLNGP